MTNPTRTAETIRNEARREVKALRAIARRLKALGRELRQMPECARWSEINERFGAAAVADVPDELFETQRAAYLAATLTDDVRLSLDEYIRNLAGDTDPKAWATYPARERARRVEREAAAVPPPPTFEAIGATL